MHSSYQTHAANSALKSNVTDFLLHAWLAAASVSLSTSARHKVELHSSCLTGPASWHLTDMQVCLSFLSVVILWDTFRQSRRTPWTFQLMRHVAGNKANHVQLVKPTSSSSCRGGRIPATGLMWVTSSLFTAGVQLNDNKVEMHILTATWCPNDLLARVERRGPRVMRFKEVSVRGGCLSLCT